MQPCGTTGALAWASVELLRSLARRRARLGASRVELLAGAVGHETGLLKPRPLLVRQNLTNLTGNSEAAAKCHNGGYGLASRPRARPPPSG
jgi:hypothetical protein